MEYIFIFVGFNLCLVKEVTLSHVFPEVLFLFYFLKH